jgi:molecular chaperone DnaK
MVKEAEAHAGEDARRREEIELRNKTDALLYSVERSFRELGSSISDGDRRAVEQAVDGAHRALAAQDVNAIRRAHDELVRAARVLETSSRTAAQGTAPGGASSTGRTEGDIVDAEVVDDRA